VAEIHEEGRRKTNPKSRKTAIEGWAIKLSLSARSFSSPYSILIA